LIKLTPKGAASKESITGQANESQESAVFGGTGIDAALDTMTHIATKKPVSQDKVEIHPERRHAAALAAYEEANIPILRKENPGLRLSQIKGEIRPLYS